MHKSRHSLAALLLVWTGLSLACPPFADAQAAPEAAAVPTGLARRDSIAVLRQARSAQARFERIRRNHFPWTNDSWGGECDERVGRFCLRHGDDKDEDDDWTPPPEPDAVQNARERLVAELAEGARQLPGDGWIAGQRVRYLTEAGRHADALSAARSCLPSTNWWCMALAGFALHAAGEWKSAEAAFHSALAAMPAKQQREWTDLSALLEPGSWRAYRRATPAERESLERRFWWLADPFFSLSGNDRRTEHFTRLVMDQLQTRARSTDGVSWGDDLRQLLLRYGWPLGWERVRPRTPGMGEISIVSHYPPRGRTFIPTPGFVEDPFAIAPTAWPLRDRRARTEYSPPYASSVEPLEHQLAVFRRGDSVIVVAAFEQSDTLTGPDDSADAALVLARGEESPPAFARVRGAGRIGRLQLAAEPAPMLLSLEVLADSGRPAARARYGIRPVPLPAGVPGVSDLLLLAGPDSLPGFLAAAVALARGSAAVRPGERIGVYWEVYGVAPGEDLAISLTLREENRSWVRRLGERAGVLREERPIQLKWQEAAPDERRTIARSLAIELPELSPGRYQLRLSIDLPGREPLTAARTLTVEP